MFGNTRGNFFKFCYFEKYKITSNLIRSLTLPQITYFHFARFVVVQIEKDVILRMTRSLGNSSNMRNLCKWRTFTKNPEAKN